MRIDLFLKASRLCLRRTIAQKLCDAGLVSVNGRPAKSSHSVKPGDEIDFRNRNRRLKVRVMRLPDSKSVAKAEAANLYEVLEEQLIDEE